VVNTDGVEATGTGPEEAGRPMSVNVLPGSPLSLQVGLHVLRLHVPGLYLLFSVTGRGDLQRAQEVPPEGR